MAAAEFTEKVKKMDKKAVSTKKKQTTKAETKGPIISIHSEIGMNFRLRLVLDILALFGALACVAMIKHLLGI